MPYKLVALWFAVALALAGCGNGEPDPPPSRHNLILDSVVDLTDADWQVTEAEAEPVVLEGMRAMMGVHLIDTHPWRGRLYVHYYDAEDRSYNLAAFDMATGTRLAGPIGISASPCHYTEGGIRSLQAHHLLTYDYDLHQLDRQILSYDVLGEVGTLPHFTADGTRIMLTDTNGVPSVYDPARSASYLLDDWDRHVRQGPIPASFIAQIGDSSRFLVITWPEGWDQPTLRLYDTDLLGIVAEARAGELPESFYFTTDPLCIYTGAPTMSRSPGAWLSGPPQVG